MTVSGRYWMIDRLERSVKQMDSCLRYIRQAIEAGEVTDDLRASMEAEAEIYREAIKIGKRKLEELKKEGEESA